MKNKDLDIFLNKKKEEFLALKNIKEKFSKIDINKIKIERDYSISEDVLADLRIFDEDFSLIQGLLISNYDELSGHFLKRLPEDIRKTSYAKICTCLKMNEMYFVFADVTESRLEKDAIKAKLKDKIKRKIVLSEIRYKNKDYSIKITSSSIIVEDSDMVFSMSIVEEKTHIFKYAIDNKEEQVRYCYLTPDYSVRIPMVKKPLYTLKNGEAIESPLLYNKRGSVRLSGVVVKLNNHVYRFYNLGKFESLFDNDKLPLFWCVLNREFEYIKKEKNEILDYQMNYAKFLEKIEDKGLKPLNYKNASIFHTGNNKDIMGIISDVVPSLLEEN
jgi:hypothetical protein